MLQIGTTVRLKKTSEYYSQSNGTEGEIIEYNNSSDHIYRIKWRRGNTNVYREIDIETSLNYEIY